MLIYENLFAIILYVILCVVIIVSLDIWRNLVEAIVSLGLTASIFFTLLYVVPMFQTEVTGIPDRVEKAGDCYSVVMNGKRYDDVEVAYDTVDQYLVRIDKQESWFEYTHEFVTLVIPVEVEVLE